VTNYLELAARLIAERRLGEASSASPGATDELGRCGDCGSELLPDVAIGLCADCRLTRNPDAVDMPAPAAPFPLHVVVDEVQLPDAPVVLNAWTRIEAPARYADANLASLREVVCAYARVWHVAEDLDVASTLGERIADLLERLEEVGVRARVVPLS